MVRTAFLGFLFGLLSLGATAAGSSFYVSPDGDDQHPGTREQPFRTLERARDQVRALRAEGQLAEEPVQIVLRAGRYFRSGTWELDTRDAGSAAAPLIIRAAEGETATLDGGRLLDPAVFRPVDAPAILARLPETSRGRVLAADLAALGITEYGRFGPRGWGRPGIPPPLELFVDGRPQTVARWPNKGHVPLGRVRESGSVPRRGERDGRSAVFEYNTPRAERWINADELFISGILGVSWAHDTIRIATLDLEEGTFTTDGPSHYGVAQPGSPANVQTYYHAVNLLEEIEVPGEYYLDREKGILYFLPPYPLEHSLLQVSLLAEPLIRIREASHIQLQRLVLENSRGAGILIDGGEGCRIAGCVLRNLGQQAIRIAGGSDHGVLSCEIYQLGAGAIQLRGGDRRTLTPAGHFIRNCDIRRVGRWTGHYHALISASGVGLEIAHNHLHQTEHQAIVFSGNEHLIEFNEIHRVLQDISDMGSIYIGRNPSFCGNIIRHNFFHHLINPHQGGPGTQAIFFDDDTLYVAQVFGNVFYRTGSTGVIKFNGGGGASIANNIAIASPRLIQGGGEAHVERAIRFMHGADTDPAAFTARGFVPKITEEVDIRREPYRSRYPFLYDTYTEKFNYGTPAWNNYEAGPDELQHFVDPENLDFSLRTDSPIRDMVAEQVTDRVYGIQEGRLEFQPIPFAEIGLKQDAYRTELAPDPFRLLGPATDALATQPDAIQLWWQPSPNADAYRLVVARDRELSDPVLERAVESHFVTLDALEPGQTYFWQVWAEVQDSRSNRGRTAAENGPRVLRTPGR